MITKLISHVVAALIMLVWWLMMAGCTHVLKAQAADIATTAVGLGSGAVEANALIAGAGSVGMVVAAGGKLALASYASEMTPDQCETASGALFGAGAGGSAANVAVLLGASGGGLMIALPLAGLAWLAYNQLGLAEHDCKKAVSKKLWADAYKLSYQRLQNGS